LKFAILIIRHVVHYRVFLRITQKLPFNG